jgi:diguanylate cyclase (GGDEF)-like protein/PAS domain S-box-containing protein
MLRRSQDAVGIVDPDGALRPGPFAMLGYKVEELAGRPLLDLVHDDDRDAVAVALQAGLNRRGAMAPFRCRLRHGDGEWRWYDVAGINLVDDPAFGGLVVNARDVTGQHAAEQALIDSEARWRRMLQSSTEQVTVLTRDGEIRVSTGAGHVRGVGAWTPADVQDASTVIHPDDVQTAMDAWAKVVGTPGINTPMVLRVRHDDGSWRWVESIANNLLDDPEVGGIVVTTRDITERQHAIEQLHEETRVLDTLHSVGRQLAAQLDIDSLLQAVTDAAVEVTDAAFGAFFYNAISEDGESYQLYTLSGAPREAFATFPMPRNTAVFKPTFDGEAAVRIDDVLVDPRYGLSPPYHGMPPGHLAVRSYLAVPVVSRMGEVFGGLFFGHPDVGRFTERGERLAAGIADHAAIAIDNARLYRAAQSEIDARRKAEADLAHQATHDPLTGLPNRTLLQDRLGQAIAHLDRDQRAIAVLLLDVDRFKVVNDSLGHAAGDEILVAVAARLLEAVRPGDTVARLGGDEFVLVCDGVNGELDAVGVADRIASAFAEPFTVGDTRVQLSASVGITVVKDLESSPHDVLRDADAVMYRAKERGGNRWEVFDAAVRYRVVERLRVENDLRRALDNDEVHLWFQPIISLATGAVVGAEGLARWQHPERGLVMPADFIPVAEASGLVLPLGELMLLDGCREIARSGEAGRTVSVNVSAHQLAHARILRAVERALEDTGADARRLSLEITETGLMDDVNAVSRGLAHLRAVGVQLWVDDFGTGYSSLIYLRRLPLSGLKLDRAFVAGMADNAEDLSIVAGIVNLAHSLGLLALAEGVETEEQADLLRELGCDLAQGFLWSPAVPPEAAPGS